MGSKGGSSVEYTQSPEQRQMYNLVMPTAQDVFGKAGEIGSTGKNGETVSLWGNQAAPASPTAPSMSRVYSGVSPVAYSGYNLGNYDLPSSSSLMPTSGWYSGLDESIKAGLNEPWNEARSSMFETLGTNLGSARGGFSGAAGAALGEFEANRANQMGLQAWEMMQPGLMADYNAQTQRAQDIFGAQTTANQYLTNLENTQLSQLRQEKQQERYGDYANRINQQQQDYTTGLESWRNQREEAMYPYTLIPSLLGGTYSSPVVNQGTNIMGGLAGGAAGIGSSMLLGGNPLTTGLLGIGGLLGGL